MTGGHSLPGLSGHLLKILVDFGWLQAGAHVLLWLLLLAYVGGPRLTGWMRHLLPSVPDGLALLLPWRRKRLQREDTRLIDSQ